MTVEADACAPAWRWARGFSAAELAQRLSVLSQCQTSGPGSDEEAARDPSWHHYYSEAIIGREAPGLPEPGGAFEQARKLVASYAFSDPGIVQGYFDPSLELRGRPMLLELKVMGLRFLCGVVVRATRDDTFEDRSVFGFRYDTLQGHLESGAEWFLLTKEHKSGDVSFRIQAAWREGTLPNWWTRIGFHTFSRPYQRAWHRLAYVRLRTAIKSRDLPPLPRSRAIMHQWQPVIGPPRGLAKQPPGVIIERET
jgi:uncharacterized protein (UPF0548 family)